MIELKKSKTYQEKKGKRVGVPLYGSIPTTCPVRALRGWLAVLKTNTGPVFHPVNRGGTISGKRLPDRAVALSVERHMAGRGIEGDFDGHSLRAGLATAAASADVLEGAIMAKTGHKSLATMRKYVREGLLFLGNALGGAGL